MKLISAVGKGRIAQPGVTVNEGDTVETAPDSWALIHMSDGAILTIRPETRLKFDEYHYSMTSGQGRSFMTLLRGTFRSVTGWIGRSHPGQYRVSTLTATIGVRGTDHEPAFFPEKTAGIEAGTYDKVNEGETLLRSDKGEILVRSGQVAHHSPQVAPHLLPNVPRFFQRHAQIDRQLSSRVNALHEKFEKRHREHRKRRHPHSSEGSATYAANTRERPSAQHAHQSDRQKRRAERHRSKMNDEKGKRERGNKTRTSEENR